MSDRRKHDESASKAELEAKNRLAGIGCSGLLVFLREVHIAVTSVVDTKNSLECAEGTRSRFGGRIGGLADHGKSDFRLLTCAAKEYVSITFL